ncbi:MAG: glycerate kinase [Ignavibacteriae bacterium]|nr:glycerate kinase [Ignavibacteriota bacterium]NOG98758.1 glycerate kinase [Ignavibacteriota bacterium]
MVNVLIAPNSFKESSTSVIISNLIFTSFNKILPEKIKKNFSFTIIPISDGGDGFLEVCVKKFNLTTHSINLTAPYLETNINCPFGYGLNSKTVYVESALILGLNLIPADKRNPMKLSSIGIGELLKHLAGQCNSIKLDIEKVVIGVGGTGTSDLGLGVCEIFGLELLDKNGSTLNVLPHNFSMTEKIIWQKPNLPFNLELILDVENPLLGVNGAVKTFGFQKGLKKNELKIAEKGFENILSKLNINDEKMESLSGAGGGLAAGLQIFFDAKTKTATQFIQNDLGINNEKYKFDIVITGEGKFDNQSLLSKGAMIVLDEFKGSGSKRFVLCGIADVDKSKLPEINIVELVKYFKSKEESLNNIELGVELGVKEIIKILNKN